MTEMKQILLLAFAVSVNVFGCGCVMSHMASFYPSVAEKKGAKPSEYGLVFGIGFASAGLSSAFSGWLSKKLGPYNIILIGCTGQALASVAFGFLDYVQDKWTFLSFCYFLRALSGWSEALNCSALISVLMKIFPNESSRIIAGFQTFLGLGMAVGPFFGSLLYQWKGFSAPFWAAGCLMTLVTILMMICLPKSVLINISTAAVNTDTNNENKNKNKTNETESLTDETETKSSKELKFGDIFKVKLFKYYRIEYM
jgi:MFS family permease